VDTDQTAPSGEPAGVTLTRTGAVAAVTIDREHVGNAVGRPTARELHRLLAGATDDPGLLAIVLSTAGDRFFCSGGDLKDFATMSTAAAAAEMSLDMQGALAILEQSPALSIAAISGLALGGGTEIALACDIRIADERVRFGLPQARLGILPGWGGTPRLFRAVGRSRALELLATGRTVDAAAALTYGLVTEVVPAGTALERAQELAGEIGAGPPSAIRAVKSAAELDATGTAAAFGRLWVSADHGEAKAARAERRAPRWRDAGASR
jgi:enoyl-CoA hydratase/carnithine racemase